MNIGEFSAKNRARCEAANGFNHKLESWSLADWAVAMFGEAGEAANIVKKLNRARDGVPGNDQTPPQLLRHLADELADVYIYLDLFAQAANIDLEVALRKYGGVVLDAPALTPSLSFYTVRLIHTLGAIAAEIRCGAPAVTSSMFKAILSRNCAQAYTRLAAIAAAASIDFDEAICVKFDATSAKIGYVP